MKLWFSTEELSVSTKNFKERHYTHEPLDLAREGAERKRCTHKVSCARTAQLSLRGDVARKGKEKETGAWGV